MVDGRNVSRDGTFGLSRFSCSSSCRSSVIGIANSFRARKELEAQSMPSQVLVKCDVVLEASRYQDRTGRPFRGDPTRVFAVSVAILHVRLVIILLRVR